MGSSGEALGDDGSSAMDGLHRDRGGSWCWHLVDNHFAARNVVDISDVDLTDHSSSNGLQLHILNQSRGQAQL